MSDIHIQTQATILGDTIREWPAADAFGLLGQCKHQLATAAIRRRKLDEAGVARSHHHAGDYGGSTLERIYNLYGRRFYKLHDALPFMEKTVAEERKRIKARADRFRQEA